MSDNPKSPVQSRTQKGGRVGSAENPGKSRLTTLAPGENLKEKQVSGYNPLSQPT